MRSILPCAALVLACCAKPQAPAALAQGQYKGEGRDALCIAGEGGEQRAGFIVYGQGNANCSAAGRVAGEGAGLVLVPNGDDECRIPLALHDGAVSLGRLAKACEYYCAPGVRFAGKRFGRPPQGQAPASDLAGDPLC